MTKKEIIKREMTLADVKMHVLAACRLGEGRTSVRNAAASEANMQGPGFFSCEIVRPVDARRNAMRKAKEEMGDD